MQVVQLLSPVQISKGKFCPPVAIGRPIAVLGWQVKPSTGQTCLPAVHLQLRLPAGQVVLRLVQHLDEAMHLPLHL